MLTFLGDYKAVTVGKSADCIIPLKKLRYSNRAVRNSNRTVTESRHTVVCRAAQEAGAQPREYIDRKKENAIVAPP